MSEKMVKHNEVFYIPLPIEDFLTGLKAPVDLYLKLSDDNFVLIYKKGKDTDKSQLSTYQKRNTSYLWVKEKDYKKMTERAVLLAGIAVNNAKVPDQHKAKFILAAASHIFNEMEHVGLTHESFKMAKGITNSTVSLVQKHRDLGQLLSSIQDSPNDLVQHSVAVSALSVAIGMGLGWQNKKTIEKLSLGGLLHDIGFKALPQELLTKPKVQMSSDEIELYESHPYKGMEMLMSIGIVPDDIVSIVYEHHENAIGQGYPRKLRNFKMHPLAKVVCLADSFIHLVIGSLNFPVPKHPLEALLYIEKTMGQPYDKETFNVLRSIVFKNPNKLVG